MTAMRSKAAFRCICTKVQFWGEETVAHNARSSQRLPNLDKGGASDSILGQAYTSGLKMAMERELGSK
jgi:hypothetical protein